MRDDSGFQQEDEENVIKVLDSMENLSAANVVQTEEIARQNEKEHKGKDVRPKF